MLENKRPIKLLIVLYKIFTKLFIKIAQVVISWNQIALMSGRLIHHSVILCNEVPDFIKFADILAVLIQIDFTKAFDTIR